MKIKIYKKQDLLIQFMGLYMGVMFLMFLMYFFWRGNLTIVDAIAYSIVSFLGFYFFISSIRSEIKKELISSIIKCERFEVIEDDK